MWRFLIVPLAVLGVSVVHATDLRELIEIEDAFAGELSALISRSAAFTPDGKILITAGGRDTILWDSATGKKLATLPDGDSVLELALSADGKILAGSQEDGIRLWDVQTRKSIGFLKRTEENLVTRLSFSPDGATLATGFVFEDDVLIWSTKTGKVVSTLRAKKAKDKSVWGLAFSGDGKRLTVSYEGGTIRIWDVGSEKVTVTLTGHTARVGSLAFEPDGRTLLSAGADKTVRRWDVATGKATTTQLKDAAESRYLEFSPSLETLAGEDEKGGLVIWDTKTGSPIVSIKGKYEPRAVTFSRDGKWLAADLGGRKLDTSIRVWAVPKPAGK